MSDRNVYYLQHKISDVTAQVKELIETNGEHEYRNFSPETIQEFANCLAFLQLAAIYLQRIDWLVSEYDNEETFHRRLNEDLDEHEQ